MYAIWKACEKFGILPPDVAKSWDDCNVWAQARLLGYSQLRDLEDFEERIEMCKAGN